MKMRSNWLVQSHHLLIDPYVDTFYGMNYYGRARVIQVDQVIYRAFWNPRELGA